MKWHDAKKEWPILYNLLDEGRFKESHNVLVFDKVVNNFKFATYSEYSYQDRKELMWNIKDFDEDDKFLITHWCYLDDIPKPE